MALSNHSSGLMKRLLPPIIIVFVVYLAYSNIFSNQFTADDPDFILHWSTITKPSLQNISSLLHGDLPASHLGNYRPIRSLVYLGVYQLSHTHVFGYHLFSLIVHVTNSLLVYLISKKLTQSCLSAFVIALLFGLHPLHTEAITFITASFDTLAFTMVFAAFYFFIHFTHNSKTTLFFFSVTSYILASFTNEIALIFPLLAFLYLQYFAPYSNKPIQKFTLSTFIVTVLTYLFFRLNFTHSTYRDVLQHASSFTKVVIAIKSFWLYIWQLLFPFHLSLSHTLPGNIFTFTTPQITRTQLQQATTNSHLLDLIYIFSLIIIFFIYKLNHKHNYLKFSFFWILIALLPTLNLLFPGALIYSERYSYLASFGFCFYLGWILSQLISTQKNSLKVISVTVLTIILSSYLYKTHQRNSQWQNDIVLMQQTVASHPQNPLTHYLLARANQHYSHFQPAIESYQHTIDLNPNFADAHFQLGRIYQAQGNFSQAQEHLRQSLVLEPTNSVYLQTFWSFCQTHPCQITP